MRILLATHGFPPEQLGGVELHTRELALELAARGHAVQVVAGTHARSMLAGEVEVRRTRVEARGGQHVDVARIARHDLYFDHWHKSRDSGVARAFRGLLREFRPDVVHVQHWIRLSRDLVLAAAREGVPGVVTLHDAWASCPLVFRVKPDTLQACDALAGPHPCVACAGRVPPRTPWVPTDAAYLLFAERLRDIARELELARAVIAPTRAHASALERWLGREPGSLAAEIVAPCAELPRARPGDGQGGPREEPRPGAPALHLATWGHVARHKGLDLLVEAFQRARAELPPAAELLLDVHGAEADPAFAAELRAATRGAPVRWRGPFGPGELERAVDPRAQVFVSAARAHESFGVSASEAARLGLALILPDAPAFAERFAGAAELYASGSARSLADAIVRCASRAALVVELRRGAREHAARLATNGAIAERHLELYARAVARGAPAVPAEAWFEARMSDEAARAWDRALSQASRAELGLQEPG